MHRRLDKAERDALVRACMAALSAWVVGCCGVGGTG